MNFDTPPAQEKATVPSMPTEEAPLGEPANPESGARAMTTEMLASAQKNREISLEKFDLTMDELKRKFPGAFKLLRMAGAVTALLMASDAAYAGGPVVNGPVVRGPVIHAAKPISHGINHAAAPINYGVSRGPVVRAPGEKTIKNIITTSGATASNYQEKPPSTNTSEKGSVRIDSSGNVSGNVRGGIDLTPG